MFLFCGVTGNGYHKYQFSCKNTIWDYEYAKHLYLAQFQVSNGGIWCHKHYSLMKSLDYANSRKNPKDAMSSKCGGSIGTFLKKKKKKKTKYERTNLISGKEKRNTQSIVNVLEPWLVDWYGWVSNAWNIGFISWSLVLGKLHVLDNCMTWVSHLHLNLVH